MKEIMKMLYIKKQKVLYIKVKTDLEELNNVYASMIHYIQQ